MGEQVARRATVRGRRRGGRRRRARLVHHLEVALEVVVELTRAGRDLRQRDHQFPAAALLPHEDLRGECTMMPCWRCFFRSSSPRRSRSSASWRWSTTFPVLASDVELAEVAALVPRQQGESDADYRGRSSRRSSTSSCAGRTSRRRRSRRASRSTSTRRGGRRWSGRAARRRCASGWRQIGFTRGRCGSCVRRAAVVRGVRRLALRAVRAPDRAGGRDVLAARAGPATQGDGQAGPDLSRGARRGGGAAARAQARRGDRALDRGPRQAGGDRALPSRPLSRLAVRASARASAPRRRRARTPRSPGTAPRRRTARPRARPRASAASSRRRSRRRCTPRPRGRGAGRSVRVRRATSRAARRSARLASLRSSGAAPSRRAASGTICATPIAPAGEGSTSKRDSCRTIATSHAGGTAAVRAPRPRTGRRARAAGSRAAATAAAARPGASRAGPTAVRRRPAPPAGCPTPRALRRSTRARLGVAAGNVSA